MKHNLKNTLILLFILSLLYYILTYSFTVNINVNNSISNYIKIVFPTLFPSIVLTNLLLLNNFPYYLNKIFKIDSTKYIFIMSILTGTPTNSIMIKNMLSKKEISIENAEKVLGCTIFNNPIFLYNTLILSFNKNITTKLIINNYIINLLLFLIFIRKDKITKYEYKILNFSNSIIIAIKKSLDTMFIIFGTIVFYNIFNSNNIYLNGILELSNGLINLKNINIPINNKIILASLFISLNGLCILTQIKSILKDTSIKYKYFFKTRLIHLILYITLNISII